MIYGFEKQTHELTDYEKELAKIVAAKIIKNIGVGMAVTNTRICENLKKAGHTCSPARLRKIINYIRMEGHVERLVATSKGYYVSNDRAELARYVESLHQRSDAIKAVANQLQYQLEKI